VLKYDFNHSDHNTEFYGVHSTGRVPASAVGIDLYWYALKHRQAVYLGTAGREIRHTLGASVYGAIAGSGLDYNFTASRQLGSVGTHNISAYMVIAQMGYRISRWRTVPRFRAGFDYASGGHSAGGDVGTFNLLFPSGHSTLGYMDIVGRQNVVDVNTGAQLKLAPKLSLELAGYKFWRAQANDAFYNKTGAVVFPGFAGSSRDLGAEANLVLRYELDRHTVLEAGYGHFFPGVFIQQSGPHQPPDFAYLSFQYTF
jgi:hypothetical protein